MISILFAIFIIWSIPSIAKIETQAKVYRKPISILLDKKVSLDIIANFDFSKFETSPNHDLFELKYSNSLSTNMFGKSATLYLGERRKSASIDSALVPRFMYINQQKANVSDEAGAKKVLEKKPGFKGQAIEFKTNKHGLKIAIGNFSTPNAPDTQHYLVVIGEPSIVFSEANMIDADSIRID